MKITTRALADNLCSMAQIVMGEADERNSFLPLGLSLQVAHLR